MSTLLDFSSSSRYNNDQQILQAVCKGGDDVGNYDFTRDIYAELKKWSETDKGLLLKGPRQVGKTYILTKFAKESFKRFIYVNFGVREVYEWFEDNTKEAFSGQKWAKVLERYAKKEQQLFVDDPDTLVIFDEIQASARAFSIIRELVRECKFRVVGTGSYLGIMDLENFFSDNKQTYFYPVGDVNMLEMWPMTYREVLEACAVYDDSLDAEAIYEYYLQYGGFPSVVHQWLETKERRNCIAALSQIYTVFVSESQRYFDGPFPESIWSNTLIGVILQIETGKEILSDYNSDLIYKFRTRPGTNDKREDIVDSVRWLLSCNLLIMGNVTNNLKKPVEIVKHQYYFVDQGLMYWVLNKELQKDFPWIDRNNAAGVLATNYVALAINEFTTPVTYSRNKPKEEIDFIARRGNDLIAIEVKFTEGNTKSSMSALERGDVQHILKIQGKEEASEEKINVLPLYDVHTLGAWLGHSPDKNKYTSAIIDLFIGNSDELGTTS